MKISTAISGAVYEVNLGLGDYLKRDEFAAAMIQVIDGYKDGSTSPELRSALSAYLWQENPYLARSISDQNESPEKLAG